MNKVAHYLQQHIAGEVLTSPEVLRYFSTDESILEIKPLLVVHPRSENDIRKVARFSWQLSERGRVVPITIRGKGTDRTGASLGSGIIITTPAHMNKIIELDPKSGVASVEPGIIIGKLQQTLFTHGRLLPSLNSAMNYTSAGGAVANNDSGPNSYKYGPIREFVRGLRVILANGELVLTERLSKRELNRKLGLASFEGEIYRSLDKLIEESKNTIEAFAKLNERSNVGYSIQDVKLKDGSFDLTPLLVGSQGTLGLISEVTFDTEPNSAQYTNIVGQFAERRQAWEAVQELNKLKDGPMSIDFLDRSLMHFIQSTNPNLVRNTLENTLPDTTLFIEIEKSTARHAKKIEKKIIKILEKYNGDAQRVPSSDKHSWMALKDSPSLLLSHVEAGQRSIPLVDDAQVPVEKCSAFLDEVDKIFARYDQKVYGVWGNAGNGYIHASPMFDVSKVGDRQKMFKLLDEYYLLVAQSGGTVAGAYAEGRLRGSQIQKNLTPEMMDMMLKIKAIFDPHGSLNPGVKVGVDSEELKPMIRGNYSLEHQYSHLPRS